jgi:hypothetical protein
VARAEAGRRKFHSQDRSFAFAGRKFNSKAHQTLEESEGVDYILYYHQIMVCCGCIALWRMFFRAGWQDFPQKNLEKLTQIKAINGKTR